MYGERRIAFGQRQGHQQPGDELRAERSVHRYGASVQRAFDADREVSAFARHLGSQRAQRFFHHRQRASQDRASAGNRDPLAAKRRDRREKPGRQSRLADMNRLRVRTKSAADRIGRAVCSRLYFGAQIGGHLQRGAGVVAQDHIGQRARPLAEQGGRNGPLGIAFRRRSRYAAFRPGSSDRLVHRASAQFEVLSQIDLAHHFVVGQILAEPAFRMRPSNSR